MVFPPASIAVILLAALAVEGQALAELGRLEEARRSLQEAAQLGIKVGIRMSAAEILARAVPYLLRTGALELAASAVKASHGQLAWRGLAWCRHSRAAPRPSSRE